MWILFYFLLMLRVARCTVEQLYEKKTILVGDDVNLTCARRAMGSLFWIRLVSGNFPEIVAKTYTLETVDPRITGTKETGTFVLRITRVKLSDAAVYICLQTHQQSLSFLKETDLRVEALEPDITPAPPRDPVCSGDSVINQCSIPESENITCQEESPVCCFRADSNQSHPSFNCTKGNRFSEYEKNPEGYSAKKCVFSLFRNISCSDSVTYYCSVATCVETISGKSELNNEAVTIKKTEQNNTIPLLLSAALAISLLVIAFLIYLIQKLKNKSCGCCNATVVLQTSSGNQQNQQTDEDSLVYSAPLFTSRKASQAERRDAKTSEEESIYTDVRTLDLVTVTTADLFPDDDDLTLG
ncbi:uncharacterized protein LOC113160153 isoform X1 [Anabas testudineus]|uniref:Immunoglobulin subtype domain-containing protein n=1 Tax=Anabas testudineus TaxID=64144 RepID=A0A3Q1H6U5_ANATE|nr:uncharacterized protein LOC113160153 isoform X1 [Anabas testudineus]